MDFAVRIAICDTNDLHAREINHILQNILFDQCNYSMEVFSSFDAICGSLEREEFHYDLLFLEVDLDRGSGLDVAGLLRRAENPVEIIFLTANRQCILEGYKYRAFDYLLKPTSVSHLSETLQRFLHFRYGDGGTFRFKIGKDTHQLKLKDILCFSSCGRMITVHTETQEYTFYGKLDELLEELPHKHFIRPHQSYVINMDFVRSYTKETITLLGGAIVPISRSRQPETLDELKLFFADQHTEYF